MSNTLILKNGRIFDGTGNPWYHGDIGIKGELISKIGKINSTSSIPVIDVGGLYISPGWIDIHMHADHTILGNAQCESYIHQGVTTATMGNCGLSMYPVSDIYKTELINYLKPFTSGLKLKWDWRSLDDFITKIERKGTAMNLIPFVGHGSIKISVMGFSDKEPNFLQFKDMVEQVELAMQEGAYGLSSGLGYPPGVFSGQEEIIRLLKPVKRFGGLYSTHMKSRIENLTETIWMGVQADLPVQISHLGSSRGGYDELHGKHETETFLVIENARNQGLNIMADIYPHTAGSSLLSQIIPDWVHEGGVDKLVKRLSIPEIRDKIKQEFENNNRDLSKVTVTFVKSDKNKRFEGMNLQEIAEDKRVNVIDAICDLLIEENCEVMNVTHWGDESDVSVMVKHTSVMPCSDGWIHAPYGILSSGKPHPRSYGAFPRYINKYVKEERLFTLEEAIYRMTQMPALRLGLNDRGIIKEGMKADLTIFNLDKIKDKATYTDPHQYPEGIPYVIVNGELALDEGESTGLLSGKVLRKREK